MTKLHVGLFAAIVAAGSGCSGPAGPSSKVNGVVRFKGQPLKAGIVRIIPEQGGQYTQPIQPDGSYAFTDLPTGPAQVVISTDEFNPDKQGGGYAKAMSATAKGYSKMYDEYNKHVKENGGHPPGGEGSPALKAELAKLFTKIPARYGNEKTTPLTFTIEKGSQVKDFDLTD